MSALEGGPSPYVALGGDGADYRYCANAQHGVCNWLVRDDSPEAFCDSCRLNRTIPDLSIPKNQERWAKLEQAKRYVIRSILRWGLPHPSKIEQPETGLAFEFLGDVETGSGPSKKVLSGHADGLITLNIAEADDGERETRRTAMGEPYRTLIGHFRHEVGHYYWDRLVRDGGKLEAFRAAFGDERADYGEALKRHYKQGAPPDWSIHHISAYATSHPWEDFAETWAHYLHIVDALETARSYGVNVRAHFMPNHTGSPIDFNPYLAPNAERLIDAWADDCAERRQSQHGTAGPLSVRAQQGRHGQDGVHPRPDRLCAQRAHRRGHGGLKRAHPISTTTRPRTCPLRIASPISNTRASGTVWVISFSNPTSRSRASRAQASSRAGIGHCTLSIPKRRTPRRMNGATEPGKSMPLANPHEATAPP
jgi:hypothetical protein